jgi:hypothetical protein
LARQKRRCDLSAVVYDTQNHHFVHENRAGQGRRSIADSAALSEDLPAARGLPAFHPPTGLSM